MKLEQINPNKNYNITQIHSLGIFVDLNGKPAAHLIYRAIKRGQLKAIDVGNTEPRYVVQGSEILAFYESNLKQRNKALKKVA